MHMLWYVWENCNKGKQKKQSKHYFNKKKNPCTLQDIINANCVTAEGQPKLVFRL